MDVKELRVGNKVLHPSNDNIIFTIDREAFGYHSGLANLEDYRPIPLTEDWLLKFGLEKRMIWVFEIFGDNRRGFHISSEGGEWIYIKYVHQLQNLYFALTREELTISSET